MKAFTIGRSNNNHIVLDDQYVSRQHAQLTIDNNGEVIIRDIGSSNGTFVNGAKVEEALLKPGDVVKCGSSFVNWQQFVFHTTSRQINPVQPAANSTSVEREVGVNAIADLRQHEPMQKHEPKIQQNIVVVGKAKSVGVAFLLAFLFGPLGLLYASITGGIVMFFLGILLFILIPVIGGIFAWIGCIIWAVIAANSANEALQNRSANLVNNNFSN